jgi:hypothetical protein
MDAPMIELKSALASLFQCGQYSDLTIVCGAKRYQVHRILLATRSTFFEGACRGGFREAESGVIDLSEDDAEAVEHMIHYFYHMDYLSKKTTFTPLITTIVEPTNIATIKAATAKQTYT